MSSINDEPLQLYLQAYAAKEDYQLSCEFIPFGTLGQHLATNTIQENEILLVFPWDICPEIDWRTNSADRDFDLDSLQNKIESFFSNNKDHRIIYIPANFPPRLRTSSLNNSISKFMAYNATKCGARFGESEWFQLSSYFSSGCPFGGESLPAVAKTVVEELFNQPKESKKVLVTDLDHTLWHGIVGEVGFEGLRYDPEGPGFKHYLYQSFLKQLKNEGILLAAVSRNDPDDAEQPLKSQSMLVGYTDFVSVIASYHAKSAQIKKLSESLNLGLDAFVFVDDNPVEIAEVSTQLPQVDCLRFPKEEKDLADLFDALRRRFWSSVPLTEEDRKRTELYRSRAKTIVPSELAGADLFDYLKSLEMSLTIHNRSSGSRVRAEQLINKTNQFNLNGIRLESETIQEILSEGGQLVSASVRDKSSDLGEIFVCLVDSTKTIRSLVMSCRVFQRKIEDRMFLWLAGSAQVPERLEFKSTPRNEPFRQFLTKLTGEKLQGEGTIDIDIKAFAKANEKVEQLFTVTEA